MTGTALAIGVAVGLVLGLTGAGGSILAVPMLMAAFHWKVQEAAPTALLAVASASALGTWTAWRQGFVRYRAAFVMGGIGAVTAPIGLHLASLAPQDVLSVLFAVLMTIVALRLFRQAARAPAEANVVRADLHGDPAPADEPLCALGPDGRFLWTGRCAAALAAIGATAGLLSGLFGVGGGFVVVPTLRRFTTLSMHSAVATSLMVIALVSTGAVLTAVLRGQSLAPAIAVPFVAGALSGMALGRSLASRIAGARLQSGFALLMTAAAAIMVWQAL